jgi:hypothetical protein
MAPFHALPGASFIVNGCTPKEFALASMGAELH